jgi:hypothetical protein
MGVCRLSLFHQPSKTRLMSLPRANNTGRPLPIPPGSANKTQSENNNVATPPVTQNLASLVPQNSTPQDSPIKVQRRLTAPGKRPALYKSPTKSKSKAQEISSLQSLSPHPLSPRALTSLGEDLTVNHDQELLKLEAGLADMFADVFDSEIKKFEKATANESELDISKKEPANSSRLAASLDDLRIDAREILVRNQSRLDSPEKKHMRLERLRTVSRATPIQRRTLRENDRPSITAIQNNPIDSDAESKTSNIQNN